MKSEKNGIYWAKRKNKVGGWRLVAKQESVLLGHGLRASQLEFQVPHSKKRGQASPFCKMHEIPEAPPQWPRSVRVLPGSPSHLTVSIQDVSGSELPLRAAGAQSHWEPPGDCEEHASELSHPGNKEVGVSFPQCLRVTPGVLTLWHFWSILLSVFSGQRTDWVELSAGNL